MPRSLIDWSNVSRINMVVQKREYRPDSSQATYCACTHRRVLLNNCASPKIAKGEYIVQLKIRVNTAKIGGESTIWYTHSRWRPECFFKAMLIDGQAVTDVWKRDEREKEQNRLTKKQQAIIPKSPGPRMSKLRALSPEDRTSRDSWQRLISTYKSRLARYAARSTKSLQTVRAINNCMDKISHYQTMIKYQNAQYKLAPTSRLDNLILEVPPPIPTILLQNTPPDISELPIPVHHYAPYQPPLFEELAPPNLDLPEYLFWDEYSS